MKYAIAFLMSMSFVWAQDESKISAASFKVGDVLEIGKPAFNSYDHIHFPRPNFIIKKGGIANYKRAEGQKVVITAIKEKKDGTFKVKLKRNYGGRFFGSHVNVSASLDGALSSGELLSR